MSDEIVSAPLSHKPSALAERIAAESCFPSDNRELFIFRAHLLDSQDSDHAGIQPGDVTPEIVQTVIAAAIDRALAERTADIAAHLRAAGLPDMAAEISTPLCSNCDDEEHAGPCGVLEEASARAGAAIRGHNA